MTEDMITRIYELRSRLSRIAETLNELRGVEAELREALRALDVFKPKRVYRIFGGRVMIEIPPEEARRVIEEELELIKVRASKLEEEQSKLLKELRELEKRLGL